MSGANWNNPVLTSTYTDLVNLLKARDESAMTQMRSSLTADTNIPTNTIRWNDTTFKWESWNGAAWVALAATYGINISGNAASASAIAWGGITGKPTTVAGYGITDINTTYAPTLTGGGASGTWSISISGTAANANVTPWSGVSGKPTTISGYGITDSPQPASQAEAEAAADNAKFLTSLRAKQQIDFRIASQAVAEAGADNSALMTSLRVKQAIAANTTGGLTLLGTIITTSGSTQSLSSLNLSGYKFLHMVVDAVSTSLAATLNQNSDAISPSTGTGGNGKLYGFIDVDLATSIGESNIGSSTDSLATPSAPSPFVWKSNLTTGSTTVTFTTSSGVFDLGSIAIYGGK
jgi:hypothetical protein